MVVLVTAQMAGASSREGMGLHGGDGAPGRRGAPGAQESREARSSREAMGLQRGAQWYGHTSWISRVALSARDAALIAPVTAATNTTAHATRSPTSLLFVYCSSYTDVNNAVDLKSPSAVVALSALSSRSLIYLSRGGAWAGRRVASCVLGEGANELAEASIVATTRVRIIMAVIRAPVAQGATLRNFPIFGGAFPADNAPAISNTLAAA